MAAKYGLKVIDPRFNSFWAWILQGITKSVTPTGRDSHARMPAPYCTYRPQVTVCESHNIPGGAAHAWERDGYTFESGPSLYSGMASRPSANPIGQARPPPGSLLLPSRLPRARPRAFIARSRPSGARANRLTSAAGGAHPPQVLHALGEDLPVINYNTWVCHFPEGSFMTEARRGPSLTREARG